jgi:hypothetical protein
MMAHENHLAWEDLDELLGQIRQCRDSIETIRLLNILVPEFDHARDNEVIEKAS